MRSCIPLFLLIAGAAIPAAAQTRPAVSLPLVEIGANFSFDGIPREGSGSSLSAIGLTGSIAHDLSSQLAIVAEGGTAALRAGAGGRFTTLVGGAHVSTGFYND